MLQHFSCYQAVNLLNNPLWRWLDIRALETYQTSHIPNAIHLSREHVNHFIKHNDKSMPVLIYCYHGISSISVAQLLLEAGFQHVGTLDGGFSAWHAQYPSHLTIASSATHG